MIPFCLDDGVGVVPYSPLARGLLARGRRETVRAGTDPVAEDLYDEADFDVVDATSAVAGERGLPAAQIALAWVLRRPAVCAVVVGATKLAHIDDAIAALGVTLSDDDRARLEAPYRPHRVLGHA